MSRGKPTDFQQIELRFACLACGAEAGHWCRTKRGHFSEYMHSERHYAADHASRYICRHGHIASDGHWCDELADVGAVAR